VFGLARFLDAFVCARVARVECVILFFKSLHARVCSALNSGTAAKDAAANAQAEVAAEAANARAVSAQAQAGAAVAAGAGEAERLRNDERACRSRSLAAAAAASGITGAIEDMQQAADEVETKNSLKEP